MEACRWTEWHRFDGWGSTFAGYTLRRRIVFFACSRHERGQLIDSLFVDDTCGTSSYVVECGKDCGANTWCATASISSHGTAHWNLQSCSHVDSRRDTIKTHRLGISSATEIEFFLRKPVDSTGPRCLHCHKFFFSPRSFFLQSLA